MSRPTAREVCRDGSAGFTLVEVLVALAIVAVLLAAIGSLMATTVRTVRTLDDRVTVVEAARTVTAGLPNRTELVPGILSGATLGHRWRAEVFPFMATYVDPRLPAPWMPQSVVVTVEAPSGPTIRIETVRLRRAPKPG